MGIEIPSEPGAVEGAAETTIDEERARRRAEVSMIFEGRREGRWKGGGSDGRTQTHLKFETELFIEKEQRMATGSHARPAEDKRTLVPCWSRASEGS